MVETVLGALAPIVVTLLLGFVAAWRHDFALAVIVSVNSSGPRFERSRRRRPDRRNGRRRR